jgi:hypothetical protein
MDEQPAPEVKPTGTQIPLPKTSHPGIVEHFYRVGELFNTAAAIREENPKGEFRLLMAAVYSCRAIVELMMEQADRGELTVDRDQLKALLAKWIPYFNLVERIRIHDFHRYGLTPPTPGLKMMMGFGPTTLTARKGMAVLQQTPSGPRITCTGNSTVKERRALYSVNGTFYDEDTDTQAPLSKIIRDYFFAVPAAVDEYEKLVTTPGGPSPSF